MRNISCYIKAVRGKFGLLYLHWEYVNIPRMSGLYKVYYKNSGGHFLPYIINIQIDFCNIGDYFTKGNPTVTMLLKAILAHDTVLLKGCPLNVSTITLKHTAKSNKLKYFYQNIPGS